MDAQSEHAPSEHAPSESRHERLPTVVRIVLGAAFVSNVGSGLTLPFLLIYLHQVRHITLPTTGLLIAGVAVVGLPVGAATGSLVDRLGVRAIAVLALALNALGTASLVLVHSVASALVPILLYGTGSGMSWPAWFALLSVVAPSHARPRLYALNFQLLNLGLGIGSVVAGLAVHVARPGTFVAVYLGDALTTVVLVAALALLPARAFRTGAAAAEEGCLPAPTEHAGSAAATGGGGTPEDGVGDTATGARRRNGGYRQMLGDRRMRRVLVATTLLAMAGYGALNAGFVGFATTVVHVTPRTVSLAFAANTAFIVVAQPIGLRVVRGMRRTTALSYVAGFFGASWLMLAVAGLWPRSIAGDAISIGVLVVFSAGEILLSPVQGPLVNDLAPEELRGRYNAASTTVYSLANVIAPAIAGVMLGAALGVEYLAMLIACCAGCVLAFRWLRQALSPAEDNARPAPESTLDETVVG